MKHTRLAFRRGSAVLASNGRAVPVVVGALGVSVPSAVRAQQLAGGALSGSALLSISPGSDEGRRRTSRVVTNDPATSHATTLLVRRWDTGTPWTSRCPRRPGLRGSRIRDRNRDRGSGTLSRPRLKSVLIRPQSKNNNLSATNRATTKLDTVPAPNSTKKIRVDPCSSVSHSLRCLLGQPRSQNLVVGVLGGIVGS